PGNGLPEARPDRNRGRDPGGDLLPLPLGHRGDHGVEEAAVRGGGVNRLLERDEIGPVLAEVFGELQEFLRVPRQSRELREGEAREALAAYVGHQPLRLWVLHDGLSRDAFQVVDLADLPAAGLGVTNGSHLVMLWALALGLVFGRDPNPDADGLLIRYGIN